MLSDKVEKRIASSVFITLAPPRRDGSLRRAPPFLPAEGRASRGPLSAGTCKQGGWSFCGEADRAPTCRGETCAFCHKAISPGSVTLEAMNKHYHEQCFTCRTCHCDLQGQRYYQKEGRPLCEACYQATLEKCAACQTLVLGQIVRALGKVFHPKCFCCVVCHREIGSGPFAADEGDGVYCLVDFYRKFALRCGACQKLILPHNGRDTYKVEAMGRSFHEDCYRCDRCQVLLSLEPTEEDGCHPLGCRLLCRSCHFREIQGLSSH